MTTSRKKVTVAQKIFEKFTMASCCDPSELGVMMAKDVQDKLETFSTQKANRQSKMYNEEINSI